MTVGWPRCFIRPQSTKWMNCKGQRTISSRRPKPKADDTVIQEIPDNIGTHAVMTGDGFETITLTQVTSWQLLANGHINGMIADTTRIKATPVLAGDRCLYPVQDHPEFKYFFHHIIANKIKAGDPETMAAFARLLDH